MRRISLLGLLIFILFFYSAISSASHNSLHARENGYFGLAGISLQDDDFRASGVLLIAGIDMGRYLSLESQIGVATDDSYSVGTIKFKSDIEYLSSVRLRLNYQMQKMIPYAYLGYSGVHFANTITNTATNTVAKQTVGHAGFSYGLGIDLFGNQSTSLFLTTGVFLDKDDKIKGVDINLRSTMIGFRYFLSRRRPARYW